MNLCLYNQSNVTLGLLCEHLTTNKFNKSVNDSLKFGKSMKASKRKDSSLSEVTSQRCRSQNAFLIMFN